MLGPLVPSKDAPVKYPRYAGIMGRMHGEAIDRRPAANGTNMLNRGLQGELCAPVGVGRKLFHPELGHIAPRKLVFCESVALAYLFSQTNLADTAPPGRSPWLKLPTHRFYMFYDELNAYQFPKNNYA